jgi:hypothetical protein
VRRDDRERRRQHLIQIHWMNLTSPAQPGKVTERGPLTRATWLEEIRLVERQEVWLP